MQGDGAGLVKLTREQIVDRELAVWNKLAEGIAPAVIAKDFNVSRQMIDKIRKRVEARIMEETDGKANAVKARQIGACRLVQAEMWAAWHKSKSPKARTKRRTVPTVAGSASAAPAIESTENTLEGQNGNPAYIDRMLKAMEHEARLTGANAPLKVAPTTPDGNQPYNPESEDEQRARFAALMAEAIANAERAGTSAEPYSGSNVLDVPGQSAAVT